MGLISDKFSVSALLFYALTSVLAGGLSTLVSAVFSVVLA